MSKWKRNSGRDNKPVKHHCYFIPYYVEEREPTDHRVYVLLGRKVLYSDQQGFFMSNAKQWVAPGGMCGWRSDKNDRTKIKGVKKSLLHAHKEFVEETGIKLITTKDIGEYGVYNFFFEQGRQSFEVFFYRITTEEHKKMQRIIRKDTDIYYYELDEIQWIPLEVAVNLMSDNSYNKYRATKEDAVSYLNDMKERKNMWRLSDMNFETNLHRFYNLYKNNANITITFNDLLYMYNTHGGNIELKYLLFFAEFITNTIKRNESTDWFFKGLDNFINALYDDKSGIALRYIRLIEDSDQKKYIQDITSLSGSRIKIATTYEEMLESKRKKNEYIPGKKELQKQRKYVPPKTATAYPLKEKKSRWARD